MTCLENIMLPLLYQGDTREVAAEKSSRLLEKINMGAFSKRKPHELSGGQQQRIAIARALVTEPDLILADEPTGSLDHQTGQDIMKLLKTLNQEEGRTLLLITHDHAVSKQCQRSLTLKIGCLSS